MVARVLWEHDVAGSNPVIPTKKEKTALAVVFSFLLGVSFEADCEAKAGSHTVGITKRSEVTLSFQSSMFATQTESCFAFGECCIPTKKEKMTLVVVFSFCFFPIHPLLIAN